MGAWKTIDSTCHGDLNTGRHVYWFAMTTLSISCVGMIMVSVNCDYIVLGKILEYSLGVTWSPPKKAVAVQIEPPPHKQIKPMPRHN